MNYLKHLGKLYRNEGLMASAMHNYNAVSSLLNHGLDIMSDLVFELPDVVEERLTASALGAENAYRDLRLQEAEIIDRTKRRTIAAENSVLDGRMYDIKE